MEQYLEFLRHIKENGAQKADRTGTGTTSIFGYQMRFDLRAGFPLVTTKNMYLKGVVYELLWFLRGETNTKYLNDRNVKIWDEWADEEGELGPIYGYQWRSWPTADGRHIDQLRKVIDEIKTNPSSRRLIVNAWNVSDLEKMALLPCHVLFQFYCVDNFLSCQLYQRSADAFLGVPFNIASYALLTMMVAQETGKEAKDFIHTFGDAHIYNNHKEQVDLQLSRKPRQLPEMRIPKGGIDEIAHDCAYEDFVLKGYDPHPRIPAPIAV